MANTLPKMVVFVFGIVRGHVSPTTNRDQPDCPGLCDKSPSSRCHMQGAVADLRTLRAGSLFDLGGPGHCSEPGALRFALFSSLLDKDAHHAILGTSVNARG